MLWLSARKVSRFFPPPAAAATLINRGVCSKLFVAGLSYDTNESVLKKAFERNGEIIEVKVIVDRSSWMSKGYGFVQFVSESDALSALEKMNGNLLDGRNIIVEYAKHG